jgi:hypothetical protein
VRSTQTIATTASVMSTAKPLVPEIALIMVTSLNAPYPSALQSVPDPVRVRYRGSDACSSTNCHAPARLRKVRTGAESLLR